MKTKHGYLIHYAEIGLKGENRPFFERKLIENIKNAIFPITTPQYRGNLCTRLYGRLFLEIPCQGKTFKVFQTSKVGELAEIKKEVEEKLKKIFGLAYFSPAILCDTRDPKNLKHIIWEKIQENTKPFKTFRVRASRADKNFELTSRDIEFQIGGFIKTQSGAEVDLEKADLTCFIEILSKNALFYFDKIPGPGGLPVTTAGKVVTLLSGGIDSPVAAWQIAKRGAKNIFVHFHSYPQTDKASQENVRELAQKIAEWQQGTKLYMIPLLPIQKEIVAKCPTKLRVILYRRMMIRLAEQIAKKEGALALITGESLGQVASQTLENINAINRVATMPILRPLIGLNKQEIINLAREIGTYEISIRPYQDCCSLFVPKHPEIKAKAVEVEKAEKALEIESLIETSLSKTTTETISHF